MFYKKIIHLTGWELSLVNKDNYKDVTNAFQRYIAEETFSNHNISPDEIYFSGEHPFIQIKQLQEINATKIKELHSKIWNEGRTPFLAAFTPTEMRLYNCYEPPVEKDDQVEDKLQIDRFEDIEKDLKRVVQLLHQSKIDSGKIWTEEYSQKLNIKNRVDKKLVANLKFTRAKLYDDGKGLPLPVIHDLLGRALFIFYLEDRNILTTAAFPKKPRGVENFSGLLNHRDESYELFEYLKEKFNGDLFPISKDENKVKPKHLEMVKRCFHDLEAGSGQLSFDWKMFRFEYIPIELISAIYEEFMSEEEEEKGKIKIREKGAYYTKPMLVEFMLNEVLSWPDENNKRYNFKILDPACGSGIFLVESYRRLIARWKFSKNKKKIDENSLREILLNSIYGIDKDTEAIKIAAFSLYLTFLNYLEPVEIRNEYLEKKRKKLEPLIRWSKEEEIEERKDKQPGNNLFQFNTFSNSDITQQKFDIIIGNPPWKKDKPEAIVADYIKKQKLPAQIACAYVDYMPSLLADEGVIALVIAAKILFNTGDVYEDFRQKLFRENEVDTIINLAVVRDIMFDNATAPGAVIVYRKNNSNFKKDYIVYCIPKNIKTIDSKQSIVIDATEVKYLPLIELLKENSKIFKIAMWGNIRDQNLINKLNELGTLTKIIPLHNRGIGLMRDVSSPKQGNARLRNHTFLEMETIKRYYTPQDTLHKLGNKHSYYRTNDKDIFSAPMVLIKIGTRDTEVCSSYIDFDCVYKSRVCGISLKNKTDDYHRALVACFNSTIALYYFFLTSSTWGVDKQGDTLREEIMSLPAIINIMSESAIKLLSSKVNEIIAIKYGNNLIMAPENQIRVIENEIDEIIYEETNISKNEQFLIKDLLNNSSALAHRYKANDPETPLNSKNDLTLYANTLSKTLFKTLKFGSSKVWVETLNIEKKQSLHVIIIHFDGAREEGSCDITTVDDNTFSKLIEQINKYVIQQHSETIYYRKVIKYYKKDKIYLIKPNEKRFWTVSEALNDADSILAELINAKETIS